jgi:tetratricopeptide (TPR) repeat protein
MASALIQMGQASVGLGELADSRSHYEEALSLRRETGSPLSVAAVLYTLGTLLVDTVDYEESNRYLTESMHIRKNERDVMGVLECQRGLGRLAAEQGRYAQAQEILQQAYAGAKREQKREMEMAVRAQMGMAALGERDAATARRWVTEGLEYWETRNHPDWIAEMERDLSQIAFAEGNIQEARRRAERSLSLYQKVGNQMGAAKSKYVLANALLRLGDTNQAEAYLLEALKYAGEKGLNRFPGGTWTWESPIIIL